MKHRLETLVNRIRHSLGGEDGVSEGAGLQQETGCDSYVYGTINQACISIIQKNGNARGNRYWRFGSFG